MAKLFQPIRFWMARFTCRKSSASSSSSCPSRPSSGLQPATIRWRAFVRRSSGRPASTKRTSATAALRSPFPYARRPRSRLGIPARLHRSLTVILHFVRMWICYVSCLRLRLPPAKHSPSARRPRSRLGIPARLRRSGGRHRFRQASFHRFRRVGSSRPSRFHLRPAFIHARRTAPPNCFCPLFGVNRIGIVQRRTGSRLC